MDVGELRVGNLVLNDGIWYRINPIDIYNHSVNLDSGFEPIELTEDILVKKCGFENHNGKILMSIHDSIFSGIIFVEYYKGLKKWNLDIGDINITMINYLHQLQNFYFVLTGEELDVKL